MGRKHDGPLLIDNTFSVSCPVIPWAFVDDVLLVRNFVAGLALTTLEFNSNESWMRGMTSTEFCRCLVLVLVLEQQSNNGISLCYQTGKSGTMLDSQHFSVIARGDHDGLTVKCAKLVCVFEERNGCLEDDTLQQWITFVVLPLAQWMNTVAH